MPFDFSRFLKSVDSRARSLRGLSFASIAMGGTAAAAVAAMVAVRLLRIPFPYWALAAFATPPFLAAGLAYLVGRRKRPRMPHLLLQLDDILGLGARLSSLYEIRQRAGATVFRTRLEEEVSPATQVWESALPVGRRTLLGGSAGLCCVALAVGLAFVPLPALQVSPFEAVEERSLAPSGSISAEETAAPSAVGEVDAPTTLKTEPEAAGGTLPGLDTPSRGETLDDVMRDLAGMTPDEAVLVPISPEGIEDLARIQGEAMRAISQLLESIQERLENAPESELPPQLTEEELENLQRELDQGAIPPGLQEGLNELVNPPPSRTVEEIVEQLLDQFGDEENRGSESQGGDGLPQSTAMPGDQQSLEDMMDEFNQTPDEAGAEGAGPGGPGGGDQSDGSEGDGEESLGGPSDTAGERGFEDPDPFGGTAGAGGPTGEGEEREVGFIREEEQGRIGSEGDFVSEFVTEGVPIEVLPGTDSEAASFRVRFDRIDSILRERGVPEGAIEIVRDYFNAISEGGA